MAMGYSSLKAMQLYINRVEFGNNRMALRRFDMSDLCRINLNFRQRLRAWSARLTIIRSTLAPFGSHLGEPPTLRSTALFHATSSTRGVLAPRDRRSESFPTAALMGSFHLPSVSEILAGKGERRAMPRKIIHRNALIYFDGQIGGRACGIRDLTSMGAGIRLNGLNILPTELDFAFDNIGTIQRCLLVWRDGDFIGVKFAT
jgi:hypothetical protein